MYLCLCKGITEEEYLAHLKEGKNLLCPSTMDGKLNSKSCCQDCGSCWEWAQKLGEQALTGVQKDQQK